MNAQQKLAARMKNLRMSRSAGANPQVQKLVVDSGSSMEEGLELMKSMGKGSQRQKKKNCRKFMELLPANERKQVANKMKQQMPQSAGFLDNLASKEGLKPDGSETKTTQPEKPKIYQSGARVGEVRVGKLRTFKKLAMHVPKISELQAQPEMKLQIAKPRPMSTLHTKRDMEMLFRDRHAYQDEKQRRANISQFSESRAHDMLQQAVHDFGMNFMELVRLVPAPLPASIMLPGSEKPCPEPTNEQSSTTGYRKRGNQWFEYYNCVEECLQFSRLLQPVIAWISKFQGKRVCVEALVAVCNAFGIVRDANLSPDIYTFHLYCEEKDLIPERICVAKMPLFYLKWK